MQEAPVKLETVNVYNSKNGQIVDAAFNHLVNAPEIALVTDRNEICIFNYSKGYVRASLNVMF